MHSVTLQKTEMSNQLHEPAGYLQGKSWLGPRAVLNAQDEGVTLRNQTISL